MKKYKLFKNPVKKQRGFALLEAMLAVIVILAAGVGVTKLYLSAKANSDVSKTEDTINQVASAANQLLSTNNTSGYEINDADLIDSGLLPGSVIDSTNGVILTPFGQLTISSGDSIQSFSMQVDDIPQIRALTLCRDMVNDYDLTLDSSLIEDVADCTTSTISGSVNTFTLYYPKGSFQTSET